MGRMITATQLSKVRPAGASGELSYSRVRSIVAREAGEEAALVLAEPVPLPDGSAIDWYSASDATYTRLDDLDDDVKEAAEATLARAIEKIDSAIERLKAGDETRSTPAIRALELARTFPSMDHVWVAPTLVNSTEPLEEQEQAVLITAWGYKSSQSEVASTARLLEKHRTVIPPKPQIAASTKLAESPPAYREQMNAQKGPSPIAVPFVFGFPAWLLTGLAFLLLALLLWWLLPACGIRLPGGGIVYGWNSSGCGQYAAAESVIRELEAEAAALEEALERKQNDCAEAFAQRRAEEPSNNPFDEVLTEENEGELQISLAWFNSDDLDIYVQCPGNQIFFNNRRACQGELDVDANHPVNTVVANPVENVVWKNGVPAGTYRVKVKLAARRVTGSTQTNYIVRIRLGNDEKRFEGSLLTAGGEDIVHEFVW